MIETSTEPRRIDDGPAPLRSEDVLKGAREVVILHGTEVYRLRLTTNGKLILTK
jgi:hemin uptake protein HemP